MKILVGTDFSPNSADALAAATALGRRFNDQVHVVHSAQPLVADGESDPLWEPTLRQFRERLAGEVSQAAGTGGKLSGSVELGSPEEVFRQMGRAGHTRMIVVSSVGRVALTRVLLGSTAERIAESAAVPTLVVRSAAPFREWADGIRPLRVFVATDFSLSSEAALAFAGRLATCGPCDITAGYTDDPIVDAERLGVDLADDTKRTNPTELATALRRDLRDKVASVLGETRVQLAVEATLPTKPGALIEMAKAAKADVLITGTHQHHGFTRLWHRSTSRDLLNDAPMSVACVPAGGIQPVPSAVPELRRVLVTTDFSPAGNRAVAAACALLPNGGRLRLFHALTPKQSALPGIFYSGTRPALSPGEQHRLKQAARRKLGSLVPSVALQRGVTVEVTVEPAVNVAAAVLQQAEQFGAQVICLSSHGRTGLNRTMFGSVAAEIVAQSHRPVHVVKLPAH